MLAYKPGDVVIVPFPFTDRATSKRRPALVCSSEPFNRLSRHVVLSMITTAGHSAWPGDVPITELDDAGLPAPSVVRWKLFTIDVALVLRRSGSLSARDRASCSSAHPLSI
jgi:mRNA interferase MazF